MGFFNKSGAQSNRDGEYYAVIDKSGLFYSGEVPDVKWCKVTLCNTYEELISKLSDKLKEEHEKSLTWKTQISQKTSYEEMLAKFPGKQIISITPNGPGRQNGHMHCNNSFEYYACVEKSGLFFSGEMPDIDSSKFTLCNTLDELTTKLTEKLTEEYEKADKRIEKMPHKTSYNYMLAHNAGKQIIAIRPSRF